jgi:glycosyltransferase involved in cell wall biosynthesis
MFASYHCYHDPTNGAAVSTRDLLAALTRRGWKCGAFTGPVLDDATAMPIGSALRRHPDVRTNLGTAGAIGFAIHSVDDPGGFPVTVFAPDPPTAARAPSPEETAGFLTILAEAIRRFRPAVLLTYGGDPASRGARSLARRAGAKVAFRLHNFAYPDPTAFTDCDAITVPSAFSRDHHCTTLGLDCTVVPPVIEPSRILVDRPDRGRFVTFVNPEPNKGVFWFARMAEVLGRERPDIPLLIVEGRARADWLAGCGVDLRKVTSLHRLANTPDPRRFYQVTRLTLVPSVWCESFGRVAAESMFNGIPVVASDRGALPEAIGSGGRCLPIPAHITPETRTPPSAEEVAPWIEAVLALWDEPVRYASASAAAEAASRAWHPEVVVPQWETFLTSLARY